MSCRVADRTEGSFVFLSAPHERGQVRVRVLSFAFKGLAEWYSSVVRGRHLDFVARGLSVSCVTTADSLSHKGRQQAARPVVPKTSRILIFRGILVPNASNFSLRSAPTSVISSSIGGALLSPLGAKTLNVRVVVQRNPTRTDSRGWH